MLQKIDAWKTSDGELHDDELLALAHETRRSVCELVRRAYVRSPGTDDQAGLIVNLIMNYLSEIGKIADAHKSERDRILDVKGSKS